MMKAQVRAEHRSCEDNRQGPKGLSACSVNLSVYQAPEFEGTDLGWAESLRVSGMPYGNTEVGHIRREWEAAVAGNDALGSKVSIDRRPQPPT